LGYTLNTGENKCALYFGKYSKTILFLHSFVQVINMDYLREKQTLKLFGNNMWRLFGMNE
jgi:hypothetical protein